MFLPLIVLAGCRPVSIALPRALTTDAVDTGFVAIGLGRRIDIVPGDTHTFRVRLLADTFITLVAEQHNTDTQILVRRPDGNPMGVFTTRERWYGPDVAYFIADTPGIYQFEIRMSPVRIRPGAYTLTLETLRSATDADRELMAWNRDWAVQVGALFAAANQRDWDTVIPSFYEWLADTEKFPARDHKHTDVVAGAITLAREHWEQFRSVEVGQPMLEAALEYVGRTQGPDSPMEAPLRAWLSGSYLNTNRLDEARREFEEAEAILAGQPAIEPTTQVVVAQAVGSYHLRTLSASEAVSAFEVAHGLLSEGLSSDPRSIHQVAYNLGSAYLIGNYDLDRARDMLEASTTTDAMRGFAPFALVDRFIVLARTYFERQEYDQVQAVIDRALAIPGFETVGVDRMSALMDVSGEAWVVSGDYAAATDTYERSLEVNRERPEAEPNRALSSSRILTMLAGLAVDQGRYAEADLRYREALTATVGIPNYRPVEIARHWARMLRDLGRTEDADRMDDWSPGDDGEPLPVPESFDVPELAENGISPYQALRRIEHPYGRNLSILWTELDLESWDIPSQDCRNCRSQVSEVDPNDPDAGMMVKVFFRAVESDLETTRLLVFRPIDEVGGIDVWFATDVLDLPNNPGGNVGIQHAGTRNIVTVSVDRVDPAQGFGFIDQRFEIVDGRFVRIDP